MFTPSLHKQRHQFVVDYVMQKKPKKVADLGCSECKLLQQLKFRREIDLLVGVDINGNVIEKKMHYLAPLSTDYLQPRYDELRVELYQGSVTQEDCRLRGFDLVTSIELIEHLIPADLEHFSSVLFGYMCPAAVIISTPNAEFNPLLPGLRGFRNSDHKFEWSRAQFRFWALQVCHEHDYEVEFTGVGTTVQSQQEQVGFCSQIAVFHRLGRSDANNTSPKPEGEEKIPYSLLFSVNYPSLHDNNILRRVLLNEVFYLAEKLKTRCIEDGAGSRGRDAWRTEDVKNPAECDGTVESKDKGAFDSLSVDQRELWLQHRCVSVPLKVLCSRCPKACSLCGSLNDLRYLLMDPPDVTLSPDGSAVIVNFREEDQNEEDSENESEDTVWAGQFSNRVAEQPEDWEASA